MSIATAAAHAELAICTGLEDVMSGMSKYGAAALCAAALSGPMGAAAQGADDWQFRASIYGYFPSVGGTTTFPASGGGSSISVDADTIIDNLEFAFFTTFEAKKGLWGVYTDLAYFSLGNTKYQSRDLSLGGHDLPASVAADIEFDLKSWVWTVAGTYQLVKTPQHTLDLVFGTRMLDVDQKLDWKLSGNLGSVAIPDHVGSKSAGLTNWDAIIGVKGRATFGDAGQWFVPYYLDIGAGESKMTWQGAVGLGYTYRWGDIIAAWRYLDYDLKSGSVIESVNFSGPAIAVGFRW
jgi:hypothetical protein